jgi:hypothetical protein
VPSINNIAINIIEPITRASAAGLCNMQSQVRMF